MVLGFLLRDCVQDRTGRELCEKRKKTVCYQAQFVKVYQGK